ncbi:MAG: CDP-glycerol glycerophosphotransferase family protein [Candidatus Andersenbacteria bacterium]
MENTQPLTVLMSAPTGFNARELLLPIKALLETDTSIQKVLVLSPAAAWRETVFKEYGPKFEFITNPETNYEHVALMQRLRPDIAVTPTFGLDPFDVPILQAAQHFKIPTLTYVASWDNVYKMERHYKSQRPYAIADHIIVWNTMMRDHILNVFKDVSPDQISVIGSPRLDFFSHHDRIPTRAALLNYLGLPDNGAKLVHIATTELYPMEYLVAAISKAVTDGTIPYPLHLYASVHPGGDIRKHEQYARKYNVMVRYSFGRQSQAPLPNFLYNPSLEEMYMLVALFKHSDLLVNHSSTVAIESFLANVPVINVMYGKPLDWWRWHRSAVYKDFKEHYKYIVDSGASMLVRSKQELVAAITSCLETPQERQAERMQIVQKMITVADGTAGRRLLDKIKEVALIKSAS